jgi:hypothetical protein
VTRIRIVVPRSGTLIGDASPHRSVVRNSDELFPGVGPEWRFDRKLGTSKRMDDGHPLISPATISRTNPPVAGKFPRIARSRTTLHSRPHSRPTSDPYSPHDLPASIPPGVRSRSASSCHIECLLACTNIASSHATLIAQSRGSKAELHGQHGVVLAGCAGCVGKSRSDR